MIDSFLPDLVTAISDCVQPVSDQCLAKGLISDSVYKRVLESGGTNEDKARTLVLAVKSSTETDGECLEIMLDILEKQLPHTTKENLLSEIRLNIPENMNTAETVSLEELPKESGLLQNSFLGRFEDSIRQHEHACTEKCALEEKLKAKAQEYDNLNQEFEALKSQPQAVSSVVNTQSQISNSEYEIEDLKENIRKLEHTIEEQSMKVKRGRTTAVLKTEKLLAGVATTWKKAKEEMRKTEQELTQTIHEKKLRIKELELESKQENVSSQPLEKDKESDQPFDVVPWDVLKQGHIVWVCDSLRRRGDTRATYWIKLGYQLGFTRAELDEIYKNKTQEKLFRMLKQWIRWYPGDSRGSTQFATNTALQTAFVKIGLPEIVHDLPSYTLMNGSTHVHF